MESTAVASWNQQVKAASDSIRGGLFMQPIPVRIGIRVQDLIKQTETFPFDAGSSAL